MVPCSRWHECLLLILRSQAQELFEGNEAQAWQAPHAQGQSGSDAWRYPMSTALTLPCVWATTETTPPRRIYATKVNDGLAFYRGRTERVLRHYLQASLAVGRVPSVVGGVTLRGRADLPPFSQPVITGVSRVMGEYISPPPSGLWGCGKRSLLSTSPWPSDLLNSAGVL